MTLDEKLLAELDELCQETERKRSSLIANAIRAYFEELSDMREAYKRFHDPKEKPISESELKARLDLPD